MKDESRKPAHGRPRQGAIHPERPAPKAPAVPDGPPAPARLGLGWRIALLIWLGAMLLLGGYELVGFLVRALRG
jgi:hypothetical protein